ncbi:MAG: hypothetical protein QXR14_08350 [Sulfolobales archaeon]
MRRPRCFTIAFPMIPYVILERDLPHLVGLVIFILALSILLMARIIYRSVGG